MKYIIILLTCALSLGCLKQKKAEILTKVKPQAEYLNPKLIIDDVDALKKLEENGLYFPQLISGKKHSNNFELNSEPIYKSIANTIGRDLEEIKRGDPYLSVTMAKKHRLFDKRWLWSKFSFYELVGVIPRFDRAPFSSNDKYRCGEVRLIYRLAYKRNYQKENIYSRLPMTFNMVFWLNDSSKQPSNCNQIAQQWTEAKITSHLSKASYFDLSNLKSLEVNLQVVRWPSSIRRDFGGYAEYILRVFALDSKKQKFKPAVMENMIDVQKLNANQSLKKELLAHLKTKNNILKFDQGIGTLPDKFLSKKAVSIAFHGIARLANRPFDQVFKTKDFENIDFNQTEFVKTPEAYIRRLNDMTCVGCHQSRSVAGFHFVGIDRPNTFSANAVKMARSGHLHLDLIRRKAYMEKLIKNESPEEKRGFSERLETESGTYGAHCSLGKDPSFSKWTCESGLECQSIDTATTNDTIGVCLPKINTFAGDPCDVGRVTQNRNPRKDKVIQKSSRACRSDQYCFRTSDGFPGGLCHNYCEKINDGEACGLIAFNGFNTCLGKNRPFTKCLEEFTGKISLKACSTNTPCRDDFVCARSTNNNGVCIPPYFLFQLRADGHPKPI